MDSNQQTQAHSQASVQKDCRAVQTNFPSGCRFLPTDEQLVQDYLMKKIQGLPIDIEGMREVSLYSFSPNDLADMYPHMGEHQWYFFTSRKRKYKNGSRPDRAAGDGYWKATGKDRNIRVWYGSQQRTIGYKKSLVYYRGSPRNSTKTNWLMQEYRINAPARQKDDPEDMKLDDVVLCKIYEHRRNDRKAKDGTIVTVPPIAVEDTTAAGRVNFSDLLVNFNNLLSPVGADVLQSSDQLPEEIISLNQIEFAMNEVNINCPDTSPAPALAVAGDTDIFDSVEDILDIDELKGIDNYHRLGDFFEVASSFMDPCSSSYSFMEPRSCSNFLDLSCCMKFRYGEENDFDEDHKSDKVKRRRTIQQDNK